VSRDNWRNKADKLFELLRNEQENIKLLTHQSPVTNKAESFAVVLV
jgi:hypothetical protein